MGFNLDCQADKRAVSSRKARRFRRKQIPNYETLMWGGAKASNNSIQASA
jgi:hypothetical protein